MVDNFHDETVVHFRGIDVFEDDVMLVTFPKCGTTVRCPRPCQSLSLGSLGPIAAAKRAVACTAQWVWKILHSLLRMDDAGALPPEGKFNSEEDFQQYWDFLPLEPPPPEKDDDGNEKPPGFCAQDLLDQPSPRLFSTHMPPRMLPDALKATGKMIYVLRNPKDAQVSLHYMGGAPDDGWDGSFERLMNPRSPQVYGTMAAHILETERYIEEHLGDRAMVVTYEQLTEDLEGMLGRLAEFLGVSLPEGKLEKVKERVAFSTMSNLDGAVGNMLTRKGETGDWRNHFTINQAAAFDEYWKSATAGSSLAAQIKLDT